MMIPIPQSGILRQVKGQAEAMQVAAIEDITLTIPIGQEVVPLPEGSRYRGFIFARDLTPAGVESALREAHRRLTFLITPADEPAGQVKPPALVAPGLDRLPLLGH